MKVKSIIFPTALDNGVDVDDSDKGRGVMSHYNSQLKKSDNTPDPLLPPN